MFEKDNQIKAHALLMWANYIETGNVAMSAADAINCGRSNEIETLTRYQHEFVQRLRTLATKELENRS
jgi:hypothetical protein